MLVCESDRSDCLQEVWFHLVTRMRNVRGFSFGVSFDAWLTGFAKNQARLLLRKRTRQSTVNDEPKILESTRNEWKDNPYRILEQLSELSQLKSILEQLERSVSFTSYRVFFLFRIEGHSMQEIAEKLNLTEHQARDRHYFVSRKLDHLCEMYREKPTFMSTLLTQTIGDNSTHNEEDQAGRPL